MRGHHAASSAFAGAGCVRSSSGVQLMLGRSAVIRRGGPEFAGPPFGGITAMLKIEIDRVKGRLYPITIVTLLLGCAPTQERVFAKAGVPEDQIAADTAECRRIARG